MYRNRLLLIALLTLASLPPAWGLQSDRRQPIDIKANRVEINQREQTSHYFGNVRMEQGSLKIDADEVVVYLTDGKLHKIIIIGNPARFEQMPDNSNEIVTSKAERMEYFASEERLLLKQNAEVNQGPNHFRGDFIEYNTLTSTVKANKAQDGNSRVHAIIQPAEDKDDAKQPPPAAGKP